jgi:Sulfatase
LTNGAHLAVLSAFAFAQPLFDILGRNATFFAARGSTSREIVLFALTLILVPPAVLLSLELAADLVSRALARALHLVFIGGLSFVIALEVLTNTGAVAGEAALLLAAGAGAVAAAFYRRARVVRSILTVLAPAPLVFLALFLFDSDVSDLVFVDTPEAQAATVRSKTPVVLIVFDELSTVSLMNRREEIDARRYPNFAALSRDATWFRSATTVDGYTEGAVPAILTGVRSVDRSAPTYSEYPHNLFTLLGASYRMRVVETFTQLCPPTLCRDTPVSQARALSGSAGSLVSDAGVVYLHLLVPEPYAVHLPSISDTWGGFGRSESKEPVRQTDSGRIEACGRGVCAFNDLISAERTPTLYFLHTELPHWPWVHLPSGRRWTLDERPIHGFDTSKGYWAADWPALQGEQRYLLQLGYTDRALGLILGRLRATGLFDRALLIVTADHGVSFRVGSQRRRPKPANLDDIAFMPLFVKLPGQKEGRISDAFARTIDIVPTIVRVLGLSAPWHVEGSPLVGRTVPADGTVRVKAGGQRVSARLSALRAMRSRTLAERIGTFGQGPFVSVYQIGPYRELLGRRVAKLVVRPSAETGVKLVGRSLFDAVDPDSEFVPSYVEGALTGGLAARLDLAIALNGRIAAVTRTFAEDGQTKFAALVPEQSLRPGPNTVDVFSVLRKGRTLVLQHLRND